MQITMVIHMITSIVLKCTMRAACTDTVVEVLHCSEDAMDPFLQKTINDTGISLFQQVL